MMPLTPDIYRKIGNGMAPSPSPFLTPRPERRRLDSRSIDWNSNRDKEVNVQVLVRCRPLSDDEQKANVAKAISCNENRREVTVTNKQGDRVFTFDKVFGPKAQQRSIYDQAIYPIVNEVLEGYNCTVFAYGQTGTGKTYTMEGGMNNKCGELPAEAGVIPRAVRQIFDVLEAQNADYSMKVTFLELYNEEITDLLAPEDLTKFPEDRQKKPVSLLEDGRGCVIVRGLEEEVVYSANEIFDLLERGAARRRTADTLLNKRSSRSHSIFSITVHMKETTVGDEELIKCGKLNLVDLAGSENILRSGAREGRAREAGEINKSLLTLGRVINALVEHSLHIPYRDSKLTRLLRDSLGGKTKTCIIATISPTANSLEETLSTLDYAYRAKTIKNKPEANQKMSKTAFLKDLYQEIEKMKQDVRAARERNGVYIPHERFVQDEAEKKANTEKLEQLEIDLKGCKKQVDEYRELYLTKQEEKLNLQCELKDCKGTLESMGKALQNLEDNYRIALTTLKEREHAISRLLHSESCLVECAKELRDNLLNASEDIDTLSEKIDEKDRLEENNQNLVLTFGSQLDQSLKDLHKTILGSVSQQQQQLKDIDEHVSSFHAHKCDVAKSMETKMEKMSDTFCSGLAVIKKLSDTLQSQSFSDLLQVESMAVLQATAVDNFLKSACSEASVILSDIKNSLEEEKKLIAFSVQQQEEGLHKSMVSAQAISRATGKFLTDLHHHAAEIVKFIEESKIKKFQQLENFETMFEEEAVRDEKLAMEKITDILKSLMAKRKTMVSEASINLKDNTLQENKKLLRDLSTIQQVSANATKEVNGYVEKVERSFFEGSFAAAETRAMMENCLIECSRKADQCDAHWHDVKLGVNCVTKSSLTKMKSALLEKATTSRFGYEELLSAFSSMDTDLQDQIQDALVAIQGSLKLDAQTNKKISSISAICSDQLDASRNNHSKGVSLIRNTAEQYLRRDYMVDQDSDGTSKKRLLSIPSLASIEAMRTPVGDKGPRLTEMESKMLQQPSSFHRTPFAYIN
ncbi:hypothetical protein Leryth_011080 [Lithospermum erythrorhizon]|nr:hypothetical protein Leryth_011080 [Lithospermum erythrorhizon]